MNYYKSWSKTISENHFLKLLVAGLTLSGIVLCIGVLNVMTKDPLLIERACYANTLVPVGDQERSELEIQSFLKKAVYQRFDSENESEHWLSEAEKQAKKFDLQELTEKGLTQKILVKDVVVKDGFAVVTADRILSSKKMKAALDLEAKTYFTISQRTASNPTGLILSKTEPIEKKESK